MEDILNNKFTDQVSLTNDFLVPEVSNYLQINEREIEASARKIITSARKYNSYNAFEKLMHEYDLSSSEGIVLMCLAEALLRIPDNKTINDLITNKKRIGLLQGHGESRIEELFVTRKLLNENYIVDTVTHTRVFG